MFSDVEGRSLVPSSAFPRREGGMTTEKSWHFLFTWLVFFHSGRTFLFSHRKHRWTEHTASHRDIKSTDNTERYSQHPSPITHQKPHPQPLSEWRGKWSHREGAFYLSQKNTDEQNTQHSTETLSQPISQNLTATFSYNVLWILYAEGLLWGQNCAQKVLLNLWVLWEKMISSVRENFPTTLVSSPIGVTSHITPLPAGEGMGEGPLSCGIETLVEKFC